jgi:CRISPR/Cas system-associated protein endoribonuclease Cas2
MEFMVSCSTCICILFDNKYQRLEEKWRIILISQGYVIHEESSLERLNHSLKGRKNKKIAKLKEINDRLLDLRYGLAQKTTREYGRIKILINEFKSLS